MNDFEFHRPATVPNACALMRQTSDPRLIAGGMSLLPAMKLGFSAPSDLIDLSGIEGLSGIERDDRALRVGAMTTHRAVSRSATVRAALPALADLAEGIGDRQVRARGTIGGSLANNDPAACYPAAALALGATILTDRREIAADDFFQGIYQTALAPDEIITQVSFPIPLAARYTKFHQPASHYALVGVFVARFNDGVRVAVTGGGNGVYRATELEQALSSNWSPDVCQSVSIDTAQLGADLHASARYRAHLVGVLAARAVAASASARA
jgi:carbon-monoxide dehydrogenase medium subunit